MDERGAYTNGHKQKHNSVNRENYERKHLRRIMTLWLRRGKCVE